jgi:hypothetical protein
MNGGTAYQVKENMLLYAFVPTVSNQSTAYIKRKNSTYSGNQVDISLSSSSNNILYITDANNQYGGGYAGTISDTWEVMVAKNGSSTYTSYSVSGSTSLTSAEFTIENGDHFYLKHTIGDIVTIECIRVNDNLSLSYDSNNKIEYFENGTHSNDNDIKWDGNTSTIQIHFSYTGNKAKSIYCTGNEASNKCATPTLTVANYNMVNLSCTTSGAAIHYTTDGTEPSESSPVYSAAFEIDKNTTVRAIATLDDYENSDELNTTAKYTPKYSIGGGSWTWKYTSENAFDYDMATKTWSKTIEAKDGTYFSIYKSDGTQMSAKGTNVQVDSNCQLTFTSNTSASVFKKTASNITISFKEDGSNLTVTFSGFPETVATPAIECSNNVVTITCGTEDAKIYYTTDGSDPTENSTPYSKPFTITESGTVKAFAVKDGCDNSKIAEKAVTYVATFEVGKTYYLDPSGCTFFFNASAVPYVEGCFEDGGQDVPLLLGKTYYFVPTKACETITIKRHGSDYWNATTIKAPTNGEDFIKLSGSESISYTWSTYVAPVAAAPTFEKTMNVVTMTSTTEGATIYYTTDGNDPTVSDDVAHGTSPVTYTLTAADNDITIKAIAVAENYANSEVAVSESYSYTEPARNTFYVYNNGSWSNIRFWAWGNGNLFKGEYKARPDIRTYDNENTSLNDNRYCQVYSGYIGTKHVYKVVVDEDITNIQFGQYDDNTSDTKISGLSSWKNQIFSTSTKTMNSDLDVELWSTEPMEQVATPVIGFSNNTVTITGVEGATIYYTTDGSKPTTDSTVYTGPFAVNADESYTVNAIAVMEGYARSVVATKTVTYVKPYLTVYVQNDGGWDKVHFWAWTEDNKYILNSTYLNDATNIQNFTATCNAGHSCVVSKGEYDGSVVYKVVLCSDTYGIKFDGKDDIKGTDNWDGKLYKTSSENTCVDFDASKWEAGEVETLDGYYIIGDLNKWLNGGTYKNNGNEYSYGYDPEKYGTAKDYEFTKVTDTTDLPARCKAIEGTWYEYKISDKSVMSGKLSGQFCIYKGEFSKLQKSVETANGSYNVTYYQPKWNDGRKQYAWTESQQTDYIADVTKGLELETMMDLTTGDNKNICLAHNYFYDAKLYFNPDANKIYLVSGATSSDGSAYKDINIYYARLSYTTATEAEKTAIKNGTKPSIKINTASMNTTNYVLDTASSQGDMVFNDAEKKMNGVTYPFYWSKRIMPGMELPAGQLLTATIDAEDYDNSSFAIQGTSIYLTDYIDVFFDTSNMAVDQYDTSGNNLGAYKVTDIASVECRIYGYSDDGSTILVCGQDGNFVQADPTDDQCWGMLNQGRKTDKFDYSVLQVLGWEDYDANSENTYPIWSTFSNDDTKCIHISAVNATKFVQFRVKYKVGSEKRSSKRVAATASDEYQTLIMPDYFETSRPDEDAIEQDKDTSEYTWVLTGGSKYITTDGLTTAIEDILDDEEQAETVEEVEAETIYYNLQGQRVKNPERGIYIRVRGSKATKVAL